MLTVNIANKDDLDTYRITVTDSRGNTIEQNVKVTGEGDASFTVIRNGLYTVTAIGTKDGEEKKVKKTIEVSCLDNEVPTVSINPNGGSGYVMPSTGNATIGATITSSKPDKKAITYQYAWSTDGTKEPTTWESTTSIATINKNDCTVGSYYLWVKVIDDIGVLSTRTITSNAFVINSNTSEVGKITLTPNTKEPTNQNVVVTATYGEKLTENRTLTCTGVENVDYIRNGTTSITVITNGQTVTATATDIAGNKVVTTYKVNNIDKTEPTTTAPTAKSTTNSITVGFEQKDSDSGINSSTIQYAIKKTSDSTWGEWVTDSNNTHTFTNLTLDTSYDVKTRVKDIAGNGYIESEVKTITTVNITKPTITLSTTEATNQNITATITYPNVESTTKQYSYNNTTWYTYTGTLTIDSNRTIYARSIDSTGQGADSTRVAIATVSNIDKTVPTINEAKASTEWTNTNKTITITATDEGGSGIAGYAITTSTTTPTSWISSTATSWTSTTTYGNGTYYVWVKDKAGNVSSPMKVTVSNIETVAPTITVSSNTTVAKSQTGTITIGDSSSGLAAGTYTVKYTWTTSEAAPTWSSISTTTTITVTAGAKTGTATVTKSDDSGTYYLHVQGQTLKDQAGNTSSPTAYGTFKLDNTAPTVTFGTNGSTTYKKSQSTTVTVADSGGSTVNASSLKYQWSQSTTAPGESTFSSTFTSGGTITKSTETGNNWYLWILAKDNVGNTTITKSNVFYLDNTTPTTTVPTATSTTNSITATFTQTDSHSGINSSTIQYAIKKTSDSTWGSWVTDSNTTHTFTGLTLNTSYDVRTQVKDTAGNGYTVSSVKTITTVNITKPTITLSTTDWTNQNITATITYPSVSGVTKQYSYDNSTWSTYSSALTIDRNKTIYARSIDSTNQGSDSTRVASLTVTNIDKTAPTMNSLTSGNTGATNGNITITGKATDTLSGIIAYQFSTSSSLTASSGGWTTITRSTSQVSYNYTVSANGTYYFYVKDAAGNVNKNSIAISNIDKTAPTISAATASTAWSNANKKITVTASDTGGSGIAGYAITTSNSAPSSWTASTATSWTSTSAYGNGTYYAWVKDAAGNVSSSKSVTVSNIETAVPTISVSSNTTAAKSQTGTITIGDSNSGLAAGTYTVKYTWTTSTTAPTWSSISTTTSITVTAGTKTGTATVSKNGVTGTYYLHVQGQTLKDQAGNTSSPTAYGTFKIDNSGPTVTFGTNGKTTYAKSQSTTVTVADSGGNSVNASSLKYQWTQSTTAPAESTFSSTFTSGGTITKSDGTGNNWYLWILAKDSLGNTTITKSNAFYLDNTVPTISAATAPTAWANANKKITITASDTGSGIAGYAITTSNSAPSSWTSSTATSWTSTTTYGSGTYYAWVKDGVGNVSSSKSVTVSNIETTVPTISVSSNTTLAKSQTGTITIGDSNSGLAAGTYTVKYTWTTSTTTPTWSSISTTTSITVSAGAKTGTATVSKNGVTGTYYLHVQGQTLKDQAGNTSSPTAYGTFKLDNSAPTVTFGTNGSTTYKKSQSTTVTVAENGGSSVSTLKYQWTQSTTAPAESTFSSTFTSGGTITKSDGTGNNWYLWILAKDSLGNTVITRSNAFYLDNTAPGNTAPTATSTTNSITVTSKQTDANSGISSSTRQYSIKKASDSTWGSWVTDSNTTHTFTGLTLNTSYNVRTQIKDAAGNGYTVSSTYTISTVNITKPTITLSTTALTNQNITATITYPNISGITKQYSYNNSTWYTYSSALTIDSNKTIYARSIDSTSQGSDSTRVASLTVTNIDKTAPTVSHTTDIVAPEGYEKITITINASDASGISSITNTTTSNITKVNDTTYTVTANGSYSFTVKDKAGNTKTYTATISNVAAFSTAYGRIEVIWVNASNTVTSTPNAPKLGNAERGYLTPVKWVNNSPTATTSSDSAWYSYTAASGTSDYLSSKWANATNSDGSYFVWIPRYAYRITYYASQTSTIITGYCDGNGIRDTKGNVKYALDSGITSVTSNGKKYIVHPAFMNDKANTYSNGGWASELDGIWVAKFEMSKETSTDGTTWSTATTTNLTTGNILTTKAGNASTTKIRTVSKPGVSGWRYIHVGTAYTNAKQYDRPKKSHLMKNSEWGAVAYLTHSQYGRNGNKVYVNNSSTYMTGNGGGSTDAAPASGIVNAYNTTTGAKASSTGNVYGVYDLSGGAWEWVALFNSADVNGHESTYGSSFAATGNASTAYETKYSSTATSSSTTYYGSVIYTIGKFGDATKEVYTGSAQYNWVKDYSYLFSASYPFFKRGGAQNGDIHSGVFCSTSNEGLGAGNNGFRVVLVYE